MADRLLRLHIQSPAGLWALVTLSYNIGSAIVAGSKCVHESLGTWLWPTVAFDWCIAASAAALALADRWCSRLS